MGLYKWIYKWIEKGEREYATKYGMNIIDDAKFSKIVKQKTLFLIICLSILIIMFTWAFVWAIK